MKAIHTSKAIAAIAIAAALGACSSWQHTDKETGVGPWFKPFTVQYDFNYAGVGKKGGY